ncbi:LuxR C-terminal-related transcriptional regulator [Pseudomonas sp. GCM10022186]|uniref:LuxR C-terminal-related transcriptional regulator n=1 Tax=Pseudomonas sp. GCM10022186 TaxID=3252650 RepID=UPI00361455DD
MHGQLTEWTRDVADVLAQPPGHPQLQALTDWLKRLTFTDHFALLIYKRRHPPQTLFDTFSPDLCPAFVGDYPALSEKLGFIISLGEEGRAVLSLMRLQGTVAASEEERQLLHSAAPVVEQVVRSAWEAHRRNGRNVADDLGDRVGEVVARFGRGVLTRREREVARLLLEGHSNRTASQQLRIAPGTVKVHRRNLYEKLGVGSQSELFALFVRELKGEGGSRWPGEPITI